MNSWGMLADLCDALGINPSGGEFEQLASVLEAIRLLRLGGLSAYDYQKLEAWAADPNRKDANVAFTAGAARDAANAVAGALAERAAADVLGFVVVDKNGGVGPKCSFSPVAYVADAMRDALNSQVESCFYDQNDRETAARIARQPFRVVPVGAVREAKPLGWGAFADGYAHGLEAAAVIVCPEGHEGERSCAEVASLIRGLRFEASPPDRPAEAAALVPAETIPATSKVGAGDWSVAPGGVEGETGRWAKCLCGGNLLPGPFVLCDRCGQPEAARP